MLPALQHFKNVTQDTEAPMSIDNAGRSRNTTTAREIHEITYWKHCTGASETQVLAAIARAGYNRDKIGRELKRVTVSDR
jgi:hypothetical protein